MHIKSLSWILCVLLDSVALTVFWMPLRLHFCFWLLVYFLFFISQSLCSSYNTFSFVKQNHKFESGSFDILPESRSVQHTHTNTQTHTHTRHLSSHFHVLFSVRCVCSHAAVTEHVDVCCHPLQFKAMTLITEIMLWYPFLMKYTCLLSQHTHSHTRKRSTSAAEGRMTAP